MEIESASASSLRVPLGTRATPPPSSDVLMKANSSVFMSVKGMEEDVTEETFKRELLNYLKEEHRSTVVDLKKQKKGLFIVFLNSWESANVVASSYKEKFMNYNVSFSLFSPQNPNAMVV